MTENKKRLAVQLTSLKAITIWYREYVSSMFVTQNTRSKFTKRPPGLIAGLRNPIDVSSSS